MISIYKSKLTKIILTLVLMTVFGLCGCSNLAKSSSDSNPNSENNPPAGQQPSDDVPQADPNQLAADSLNLMLNMSSDSHMRTSSLVTGRKKKFLKAASLNSVDNLVIRTKIPILGLPAELTRINDWVDISSIMDLNLVFTDLSNVEGLVLKAYTLDGNGLVSSSNSDFVIPVKLVLEEELQSISISSVNTAIKSWSISANQAIFFKKVRYKVQANLYQAPAAAYNLGLGFKLVKVAAADLPDSAEEGSFSVTSLGKAAASGTSSETSLPKWALNISYAKDYQVHYNGKKYYCYQPHTSYSSTWDPASTKDLLWKLVGSYSGANGDGTATSNSTTTDDSVNDEVSGNATTASSNTSAIEWGEMGTRYNVGDLVIHIEKVWECIFSHPYQGDPNWAPGSAASLWKPTNLLAADYTTGDSESVAPAADDDPEEDDAGSVAPAADDDSEEGDAGSVAPDADDDSEEDDAGSVAPDADDDSEEDAGSVSPEADDDPEEDDAPAAPTLETVQNGHTYETQVLISVAEQADATLTAKIDGESFSLGTMYSTKGVHKLVITATDSNNQKTSSTTYFRIGDPVSYTAPEKRVVAYFIAWGIYGRNYHVSDLEAVADKITHINYAFANISNGRCVLGDPYADTDKAYLGDSWDAGALRGCFNQLIKLKENNPHIKTLISIGGWTWSKNFSDVALSSSSRRIFAESAVDFMLRYGFDGIDIDWEYPVGGGLGTNIKRPVDKHNYTLLMQEIRNQLDAIASAFSENSPHFLTTIATPAGESKYNNIALGAIEDHLDWINIMTYDFYGSWNTTTGHNAPLYADDGYDIDHTVNGYINAGVPANKIVLGVPFYGRSFKSVPAGAYEGYGSSTAGAGPGTWENGVLDYQDIKENYKTNSAWEYTWDDTAKVPYLYNEAEQKWISYDNPQAIRTKTEYVNDNNLGGVMFWDITSDDDNHTLLKTIKDNLD